jgi:hypothetical protein
MTKGKSIIVTVEDAALEDIHDLANRLRVKGMSVDRVMPVTGVITGTCHSSKIPTLQKVQEYRRSRRRSRFNSLARMHRCSKLA